MEIRFEVTDQDEQALKQHLSWVEVLPNASGLNATDKILRRLLDEVIGERYEVNLQEQQRVQRKGNPSVPVVESPTYADAPTGTTEAPP